MRTAFARMRPNMDNLVIQVNTFTDVQLLCVECGWESSCSSEIAGPSIFKLHPCRLVTESVSTSD